MTDAPFLSAHTMQVTIPRLNVRALETDLGIEGRQVQFRTPDGTNTDPIEVVVVWANQEPERFRGTTDVIGVDGDLHARPDDVVGTLTAGTLFQLDGNPCEVTQDALAAQGVGIVPFRMTGQGG